MLQKLTRAPFVLTLPSFTLLLMVFGVPITSLLFMSLNAPDWSFVNYQRFLSQSANIYVLLQTIEISIEATAICLVIGYPTAYLIVTAPERQRTVFIVLVLIPWLTSGLVRTYAWTVILGDHGLINNVLVASGLASSPVPLIYNRFAVFVGMVHIMLPMMILPLLSVMYNIDKSLVAAARSMGARPSTAFWRVFLPLSLPGVRSGSLLVFVGCLGFYITPQALGGLRETMLSKLIVNQLLVSANLAATAATAFVLLAVTAVVLSIFGLDLSGSRERVRGAVGTKRRSWLSAQGAMGRWFRELGTSCRASRWQRQLYRAAAQVRWVEFAGAGFMTIVMVYLLVPGLIVIIMSFSAGDFIEFPPSAFSLRWYVAFFEDSTWTTSLSNSVEVAIDVALLTTATGTLAAYGLGRMSPQSRSFLTMMILMPITFPVVLVGVAAYYGLFHLHLIGTKTGLVLAHSIGANAYVVVIVAATLANFDRRLEQAAMSMRAGPLRTFWRVTLPLIRPGILGGAVFAFIASFDEAVVTSMISGYSIRTLPLRMLENVTQQIDPSIAAVGSLLTLLPVLWLFVLYVLYWRSRGKPQRAHAQAEA